MMLLLCRRRLANVLGEGFLAKFLQRLAACANILQPCEQFLAQRLDPGQFLPKRPHCPTLGAKAVRRNLLPQQAGFHRLGRQAPKSRIENRLATLHLLPNVRCLPGLGENLGSKGSLSLINHIQVSLQ